MDFLDAAFGDAWSDVQTPKPRDSFQEVTSASKAVPVAAGSVWEWVKAHKGALLIVAGVGAFVYLTMAERGGSFDFGYADDGYLPPRKKIRRLRAPVGGMTDDVRESALRVRKSARDATKRRRRKVIERDYKPIR